MKALKLTVCVLFFAVCSFFSLAMLIGGSSFITEGGVEKPELFTEDGINRSFGSEYEEYFSRAFAYRRYVVDLWSDIRINLFAEGNDQVVVGRDGFLFFADTVDSYAGLDPMTDAEIEAAADSLLALQDYAVSKGAEFCFLPAPDKNTIYPENMPSRYIKAGRTDLDRLLEALTLRGVVFVDAREALADAKSSALVYHRRDTHWTPDGAGTAFGLLAKKLGFKAVDTSLLGRVDSEIQGDLDTLLYPGRTLTEPAEAPDFSEEYIYTSAYSTPMDMIITTRGAGSGRALVFRDSFCNALIGYFASSFSETTFERANPYRIDLIGSDCDYVIVEIAERNLKDLIGCDERISREENQN